MKTNHSISNWLALAALAIFNLQPATAFAQGTTAFTYQGQLHDGGTNANGTYTMIFNLYDAASGGNQIGSTITTSPTLVNGLYSVNLDFGAGAFDGTARWLGITVTNGSDTQTLSPRVQVLPSPYALYAGNAETAANLSGGTWNATIGNYNNHTNVFGIFAGGSLVFGMSTNGARINTDFDVNGGISVSNLNFDGGGSISGDGQGGLNINGAIGMLSAGNISASGNINANGNVTANGGFGVSGPNGSWLAQIDSSGNISASGNINANNLNVTSGALALGSYPAWSLIYSDGNGGVSIGGTVIDPTGISISGNGIGINVNGYTKIDDSGNIQANWFNGLGVNATIGCTAPYFNTTSDRNLKEKFTPVDNQEILEQVASLPISRWNFKTDGQTRHIGPMAQDFYAAFNVGTDDKHIATVDEDGVALAAIQGLNEKLKEKDAELQKLKSQNEALEKRLTYLEQLFKSSVQK
jgi:Chaperone of endosialidase